MKLSTSTGALGFFTSEEAQYHAIARAGFRYVNYDINTNVDIYTSDDWKIPLHAHAEKLKAAGLAPIMAHGPYQYPLPEDDREALHRNFIRTLKCCKELDIPYLVFHPHAEKGMSHDEFLSENRKMLRALIPTMEETGVMVLIENIGQFSDPHFLHDGAELKLLIETAEHPMFGACWDTGHANHTVSDQRESLRTLGGLLKGLHIHDNLGDIEPKRRSRNDMHTLPLFGTVDFDGIIATLREIGYDGYFNFEADKPPRNHVFAKESRIKGKMDEIMTHSFRFLYETGRLMLLAHDCFEES